MSVRQMLSQCLRAEAKKADSPGCESFIFKVEVQLICNVVLVSGIQRSDLDSFPL